MIADPPARLVPEGVLLTPRGARLVLAALEMARRQAIARDGTDPLAAGLAADYAWLRECCQHGSFAPRKLRTARDCAPALIGGPAHDGRSSRDPGRVRTGCEGRCQARQVWRYAPRQGVVPV